MTMTDANEVEMKTRTPTSPRSKLDPSHLHVATDATDDATSRPGCGTVVAKGLALNVHRN
jgi:hypothetical protein